MKKSIFTLIVIAIIGFASQSCETSSGFEDVVVQQNNVDNASGSVQDQKDRPGGD